MKKSLLLLFFVFLIGTFLRTYRLDKAQPSLNWDEASFGYNAYSIWKTGKDEYGAILPTSFRSFDDYKPPVYSYMTAPIIGIFELNEFNTRFLSAISGSLVILVMYIFAFRVTKKREIALLTSLLIATCPQLIHFSRSAFEATPAALFFMCGICFWISKDCKISRWIFGLFLIMISAFTYNSHKVYFGMSLMVFIYAWNGTKHNVLKIKHVFIVGCICLPIIFTSLFTPALARFSGTSIFTLYKSSRSIYEFGGEIVNRYVGYFSPTNLFVRGTDEPGQKVLSFAVFFPFLAIFFLIGSFKVFNIKGKKLRKLWLLAPIPAILTWNWFTPIRIIPHWFITCVVLAVGIKTTKDYFRTKIIYLVTVMFLGLYSGWAFMNIQYVMPFEQYGNWQWGFRETIAELKNNYPADKKIVWESPHAQPYIFVLFYSVYPPEKYHLEIDAETKSGKPRKIYDFGKYTFRKIYWPKDKDTPDTIYVGGVYSLPEKDIPTERRRDIIDPQGYTSFRIVGT